MKHEKHFKLSQAIPNCLKLLLLLILTPVCSEAAEWQAVLKNVSQGPNNTIVYLQYTPEDQTNRQEDDVQVKMTRPHIIEINFRRKGTFPVVLSKEEFIELKEADVFPIGLYVKPGMYEVSINITDRLSDKHTAMQLEYRCQVFPNQLSVSDIFLSYQYASSISEMHPILDLNLAPNTQKIHFLSEIYAPFVRQLSVRAILYQEVDSLNSSSVSIWLDIRKITRVLKTETSKTVFGDVLNISGLKEGRYMLQIHIYDQDSLVLKPSTEFVIEGGIRQKIFDDLETSISMMRYILPSAEINRLESISSNSLRETEFKQAWVKLYGEAADSRMKAYYKRIYAINERLEKDGENWESDRGRIYLQYGEPVYNDLSINGKEYVRWTYVKWDLSFLFEKRNQSYILVE